MIPCPLCSGAMASCPCMPSAQRDRLALDLERAIAALELHREPSPTGITAAETVRAYLDERAAEESDRRGEEPIKFDGVSLAGVDLWATSIAGACDDDE